MTTEPTINVFNAAVQRETPHTVDIDGNGEIVLTCTETGRALKFPAGTTPDQLKSLLAEHQTANVGHVTQQSIEDAKQEIIAAFTQSAA